MPRSLETPKLWRWRFALKGTVQGVGFRPFVYRLAVLNGLTGKVWNDSHGVVIECQGSRKHLTAFRRALREELPPLARIDHCEESEIGVVRGEPEFKIIASVNDGGLAADAGVTIDSAVCPDCLREMRDPADRRHGHALINCTNCGPRFSIIRGIPYDRPNTTMAAFAMCPRCAAEYRDPSNRRFHAQPVCCPECGPQVRLSVVGQLNGKPPPTGSRAIEAAARMLWAGKIVAIKGLGGFHLAVRADDAAAVSRLRTRKKRDDKPFAIMVRDIQQAQRLANFSSEGLQQLASPAAPIVLAPHQSPHPSAPEYSRVAPQVAPGTHLLGIMLPYTPIHHLLFDAMTRLAAGKPPPPLVMTSGNVSSEPLAIDNDDALKRLGPLCDAFLLHDRPIERPVDDSVVLDLTVGDHPEKRGAQGTVPIRRSRGLAPTAMPLPDAIAAQPHPTGICVGGELKNTVAVVRQRDIILSGHLGDLTHALAFEHFEKAVADLVRLFEVKVDFVAHDLHPGYMSTQAARKLAAAHGAKLLPVQHHHAHAAAVMAEHGLEGPALALVCDGTGFGPDGTIWGGELLLVQGSHFRRVARLKPMRLPGGDAAAVDPRRSALAMLHRVYGAGFASREEARCLFPEEPERLFLANMIGRGVNSPWTSSTGRLFDAVAALLGVCMHNGHEAQAAMALEAAAAEAWGELGGNSAVGTGLAGATWSWNNDGGLWELDMMPVVRSLLERRHRGEAVAPLSADFHLALARGWTGLAAELGRQNSVELLVCSGGSFCNSHLVDGIMEASGDTFRAFFHKLYPPTDAGVALGQAIIATRLLLTDSSLFDKRLFDRNILHEPQPSNRYSATANPEQTPT